MTDNDKAHDPKISQALEQVIAVGEAVTRGERMVCEARLDELRHEMHDKNMMINKRDAIIEAQQKRITELELALSGKSQFYCQCGGVKNDK